MPTGTNLLGLVKHVASVEAGYFGETFGRPFAEPLPWLDEDAEPNADMWATAEESREDIVDLYRRVWAHSDATIDALALDAIGHVPWWPPERNEVTLHRILVHMIAETNRHAGHADIVRELIDGAAGLRAGQRQPARPRPGVVEHLPRPARNRRARGSCQAQSPGLRRSKAAGIVPRSLALRPERGFILGGETKGGRLGGFPSNTSTPLWTCRSCGPIR